MAWASENLAQHFALIICRNYEKIKYCYCNHFHRHKHVALVHIEIRQLHTWHYHQRFCSNMRRVRNHNSRKKGCLR